MPFNDIYLTTHFMDTGKSDYYKQGFEENKSLLKLELRKNKAVCQVADMVVVYMIFNYHILL